MVATTIYALCDPDLHVPVIRYIGKTVNLMKRASEHRCTSIKSKTHLGSWLRSLAARGEKPVLMTLTEVPDEIGSAAEILYIRLAREGGMDLVNGTDGGDGAVGAIKTPEVREKLRVGKLGELNPNYGKKHSEEECRKISAFHRGRKRPGSSSQYVGVYWCRRTQKWCAEIWVSFKKVGLGRFKIEADAAHAFDEAARKYFGLGAKVNFPVTCCGSGT